MSDTGYDEWLDAVGDGEGFYLECPNEHGSLPPRRVCPHCGSTELTERPLPESGRVETYSEVHVPTPRFAEDAPYTTAIAAFGPVRLTALVRGLDADDLEVGIAVRATVEASETTGEPVLVFRAP
jgi:uncharacterized OB-fold protein